MAAARAQGALALRNALNEKDLQVRVRVRDARVRVVAHAPLQILELRSDALRVGVVARGALAARDVEIEALRRQVRERGGGGVAVTEQR